MPYKDKAKQREAVRRYTANWYEGVKDDPEFILRRAENARRNAEAKQRRAKERQRLDLEQIISTATASHDADHHPTTN